MSDSENVRVQGAQAGAQAQQAAQAHLAEGGAVTCLRRACR
jgi:hypothetical protein